MENPEQRDHVEHPLRSLGRTNGQLSTLEPGQRIQLPPRFADGHQDSARIGHQQLARRRDPDAAAGAFKQTHIEFSLQPLDLMAQRRLHHMTTLELLGEAQTIRYRNHILKLAQIHLCTR